MLTAGVAIGDLRLVDHRATQEARLVVVVVGDDFEDQRADLVLMADQGKQQAVGVVEPRPVELAVAEIGELLDLRRAEVVGGDRLDHLAVGFGDT